MKPKNVSVGFSNRKQHNLKYRLLPLIVALYFLILFSILLWIDLTKRFVFLVPIALAFLAFGVLQGTLWIWYKYIRYFGFPTLQVCRKTLELNAMKASANNPREAQGRISDVIHSTLILAYLFILLWHWTGFTSFLYPAVFLLSISVKAPIRRARPPAVLLLGGSSYDATQLQLQLVLIFGLSLVGSGLFHKENATVHVSGIFSDFTSIRTVDYGRWQEMIVAVLPFSRIVIIDIRNISEAVQFEITQANRLCDPERVFYVGQSAESVSSDRCFGEAELLNELRMKYSSKKVSPPQTPSTTFYEDKKNGYFRFIPPAGWTCSEQSDSRTRVTFTHPLNPGVHFRFIVKEDYFTVFAALALHQKKTIQEIEAEIGATCQMEVVEFAGQETIEIMVVTKDFEVSLVRLFIANGLHFNITYYAPNKATFDASLDDVNHALETIETLNKSAVDFGKKLERISQQEIAGELRLAELSADFIGIDKANKIIAELLRKCPDNKDAQKMAKDLKKITSDGKK